MLSLKKYLDMDTMQQPTEERQRGAGMLVPASASASAPALAPASAPTPTADSYIDAPVTLACYRSALLAIGKSAVQGIPALGAELEQELQLLERRLIEEHTPESLVKTHDRVEALLADWGTRTSEHLKGKADDVKELLVALARTAEAVGSRDQRYKNKFDDLTVNLEKIGTLDSLTQIRDSLVMRVSELRSSVEAMTVENQKLVTQLRSEVSSYEVRLRQVERMVLSDDLTGVANRRCAEEKIQAYIANREQFCVLMLDVNKFKQINDQHGHLAGDEVLRQFAHKLQVHSQPGDLVCRWGGDEFVVVLPRDSHSARSQVAELKMAICGPCIIQDGHGNPVEIHVGASMGLAQWRTGQAMQQLIAQADGLMYQHKRHAI